MSEDDLLRIERCLPTRDDNYGVQFAGPIGQCGESQFDSDDVLNLVDEARRLHTVRATLERLADSDGWHDIPREVRGVILQAIDEATKEGEAE